MDIQLPVGLFNKVLEAHPENVELLRARDANSKFGSDRVGRITLNGSVLDRLTLRTLWDLTKDKDNVYANSIEFLYKASKNPSKIVIKSMGEVRDGLIAYLNSGGIKSYVFQRGPHKAVVPYLAVVENKSDGRANRYRGYGGYAGSRSDEVDNVALNLFYNEDGEKRAERHNYGVHTLISVYADAGIEYEEKTRTQNKGKEDEYTYTYDVTSEVGVPIEMLLRRYDLFLENEELHELLDSQYARYSKYLKQYGKQFLVRGIGDLVNDSNGFSYHWRVNDSNMLVDGKPGRCIMNTVPSIFLKTEDDDSKVSGRRRSFGYRLRDSDEEQEDQGLSSDPNEVQELFDGFTLDDIQLKVEIGEGNAKQEVVLPLHPKLRIFHLNKMQNYLVHVNNVTTYKYKEDISKNLILEEDVKDIIKMLVVNSATTVEDVIEGKSQSTVIAAVGDPGLGKTLMCEVMAEACQKPLYKVQAAQLGLTAEELEQNLQRILKQAQRWNAILMIDEANAYIHSRGRDIKQNAIVGVFLRLLDYYKGVLVLTTNMTNPDDETVSYDIDPAIISRCAAVIPFNLPDQDLARQLWELQSQLANIELGEELLDYLVENYPLSGRTIRNMIRMASSWAIHKGEDLTSDHFDTAARFIPMSVQEDEALATGGEDSEDDEDSSED